MTDEVRSVLDELLADLEAGTRQATGGKDAIDAILSGAPRETAVDSLRDHEAVRRFRRELADGIVRVDTVNQLLSVLRTVIAVLVSK